MTIYNKNKAALLHWSISLVFITLPFPKESLNSFSILLLIAIWILTSSIGEKLNLLKRNRIPFFVVSSLFALSVLGLIYSSDFSKAFFIIKKNSPLLVLPLIIFSSKLEKGIELSFFKLFSFSVFIASIYGLIKALLFKIYNLGDFFYYTELSKILDVHPTYYSLFTLISLTYFFIDATEFKTVNRYLRTTIIIFHLTMLYFLSSRLSFVILTLIIISYVLFNYRRLKLLHKLLTVLFSISLPIAFFLSPNFEKRDAQSIDLSDNGPTLNSRLIHWRGVVKTISESHYLYGKGTGNAHDGLYDNYIKTRFELGYLNKFNAHNQYLETILYYGLIGLICLCAILIYCFKLCITKKDFMFFAITLVFSMYMITESLLERQKGIIPFTLFLSICIYSNYKLRNE